MINLPAQKNWKLQRVNGRQTIRIVARYRWSMVLI